MPSATLLARVVHASVDAATGRRERVVDGGRAGHCVHGGQRVLRGQYHAVIQRALAGAASALVFVCGGVLAARLPQTQARPKVARNAGAAARYLLRWFGLWHPVVGSLCRHCPSVGGRPLGGLCAMGRGMGLACLCALATLLVRQLRALRSLGTQTKLTGDHMRSFRYRDLAFWSLAGYALFGVGYIGYMTFVIALLREQGTSNVAVTVFYGLLGMACIGLVVASGLVCLTVIAVAVRWQR